jgi:hypothetical protein
MLNMRLGPVQIVKWQLGNAGFQPMLASRLAEGRMSAPNVSVAAQGVLQKGIDSIIGSLTREITAVGVEADLVSPAALRVDPNSPSEISYIGQLPPQEIRSALTVDARELWNLVDRVQVGALSHYLTAQQASGLSQLKSQAAGLVSFLQNQDTMPVAPQDQTAVDGHLAMHLKGPGAAVQDAEKAVVTAEAGSVPVLEPSEKHVELNIAIGVGIIAVAGFVLWSLLG